MDNLREDFKNWLVRQGISDKLINGKSSTVYEYIRQLDILSKKLYNSDDWNYGIWRYFLYNLYLLKMRQR